MRTLWLGLLIAGGAAFGCASGSASGAPAPQASAPAPQAEVAPPAPPPVVAETPPLDLDLRLVDGIWAPFTDVEGKPRLALALVHEALRRAGVRVQTTLVGPGALMGAIEHGGYDGSEALWKSPEREAYVLYSKPYLQNRLVLLGLKGTDVSAKSVAELKGKKLGVVAEYAYGPEILEVPGVKLVRGRSDEDNLRALLRGQLDYIVVDDLLAYHLFESDLEKSTKLLAVGQEPIALRGLHLGLRKDHPRAAEILEQFDKHIAAMVRDGSYNRLLSVLWISTDADGDGRDELVLAGNHAGLAEPSHRYQLFGAPAKGSPRILIEGQIYEDWAHVPDRFKLPPDPLSTPPSMQAVLVEF